MAKIQKNKLTGKKEKEKYENFLLAINFLSRNQLFDFFCDYLSARCLAYKKTRYGFIVTEKKTCVFIKFGFDRVEKVDIVRYYNQTVDGYNIVIIGEEFSDEVIKFAKRFNGKITLVNGFEFYNELKTYNCFPKTEFILSPEREKPTINFKQIFKRKNAKNFFVFGIVFFVMSFFVSIKTYYLISGSFFLILSTFCVLFGSVKQKD